MRLPAASLLSATFLGANLCLSQSPYPAPQVIAGMSDKPVTSAEIVHHLMFITPPQDRRRLALGDVEFVLKCGAQHDAETLFADIENTPIKMFGFTVVEANENSIRVAWDDGFEPPLGAFTFNFDPALRAIPSPGEKVVISGTYASYTREPFQIVLRNSAVSPMPPPVVIRPRVHQVAPLAPPD